jgi:hypothetical protein
MRPSTRIRFALRAALNRRFGYAALRLVRRGVGAAIADHFERSVGARPYAGAGEMDAIAAEYYAAIRRLFKRWPNLSLLDERARP